MNKPRRIRIAEVIEQLDELLDEVSEILDEEREYRDNMPENFQLGDRYAAAEEACDNLAGAYDAIDEARDGLEEAMG